MSLTPSVAAFDGSNAFRLNTGSNMSGVSGGGTLSQTINLVAGQTYFASSKLAVAVVNRSPNADGGTVGLIVDGSGSALLFGPLAANETQINGIGQFFVAPATGPAEFSLTFSRMFPNFNATPALYHYADDLSVMVVPEPETIALAAIVGALLPARRYVFNKVLGPTRLGVYSVCLDAVGRSRQDALICKR